MLRFACLSVLTLIALYTARPAPAPPAPAPQLEAGGCGWWECSETGSLYPSSYVCAARCVGGVCGAVNVCE